MDTVRLQFRQRCGASTTPFCSRWMPRYWLWVLAWGCVLGGLTLPARAATERAEVAYAQGIVAYDQGNYLDALEQFRLAVEQQPDDADAQFYLGLTLSRIGEFADAVVALEKALALNSSLGHAHQPLALAYIQVNRYGDALAQLRLAEQFDAENATTQLYKGYTEYLLKNYDDAVPPLERAITFDPKLLASSSFYQGLAFYEMADDTKAREAFLTARDADPNSTLGRSAQVYLNAIEQRAREQRLFQVQGIVSFQYDDNVILEPNDDALAFGNQADGRIVLGLDAKLIPVRTPRLRLGVGYQWFQSVHFELSDFDIRSHTVGGFARYSLAPVTLGLDVNYAFTLLANEAFSEGLSVLPSVTIQASDSLFSVVSVQYRQDYFKNQLIPLGQENVRDRDGWGVRSGIAQYYVFNRKRSSVRLSYHYDVQRNEGTDWEYDGHDIGLGVQTLVWPKVTLNVDGGYSRRNYLHTNSFDAEPLSFLDAADQDERRDDRLVGALTVRWELKPYLFVSAGYAHTSNLSNIAFFEYRRNIVTLALTGRY